MFDYALVVWRHRWLVAGLFVVSVLVTLGLSLMTPKTYEATATLLAPRESGGNLLGGLAASGLLQQIPGVALPSLAPNRDMLVGIMKSRTVAEALVERFQLRERYQVRFLEDAVRKVAQATTISVGREGLITLRAEDRDPKIAAAMANFYVEQLDLIVTKLGSGEAGRNRGFISEQLARAKGQLDASEEALRRFQERNRAIVLQEQTKGAIEAAARLKGEILATEVQLQVMRNFATDANPEVVAVKRRIEEMKRHLAQMQYGDGLAPVVQDRRDFTVPFARVPEVGLELARLTREMKIQETVMTLLTQQLEQAKIAEAKDLPAVQVLDPAVPPERHARPRIQLNMMIAGAASLIAGIFLAFLFERPRSLRSATRTT